MTGFIYLNNDFDDLNKARFLKKNTLTFTGPESNMVHGGSGSNEMFPENSSRVDTVCFLVDVQCPRSLLYPT